ncbi:glycosyltransferase [Thalassovita aquimarina]|uniref:Glycosyltransferase 2-like domain-containing protein n=1 Tax=Thalassovita aquimarina TaxID=2785917 RepID=A0ABS5HMM5_9RHOB|nr:glycosyltransferase [Thalassovita aquimarina]MBR9650066.1 hypothetical protein [Thalassovita aquimarina]
MISILVTIGDMAPVRREPVLNAVRENLKNPAVREVFVLTEGDPAWLPEEMGQLATRLHIEKVSDRPTFGALFEAGNRLLAAGADCIAIMNADISIPTESDAERLQAGFGHLNDLPGQVVFTLARHEQSEEGPRIELFEASGVPNYISADAWVFHRPVELKRELFYCPGQMNCDMFLAHDLISSGYTLFNPCLDVTIQHHEPTKDDAFYKEKNQEEGVRNLLEQHMSQNGIDPFNYYRIPWISTEWLKAGYRPRPLHTNSPTIILTADEAMVECPDETIAELARICADDNREGQIVCAGDVRDFFRRHAAVLADCPGITISPADRPLQGVREGYLLGRQYSFNSIAFVNDLSRAAPEVLTEADCVFVGTGAPGMKRPDPLGCTLVTSVFRSDDFLQGFINNSVALEGYDSLIDHTFLVANMSELEARLLNGLMAEHSNATVFWNRNDPGLYACWNLGIRMARHDYVSNANVDDLRDPTHVVALLRDLEQHPEALVAATALNPFYDFPADGSLPEEREGWYSERPGRFRLYDLAYLSEDDPAKLVPHNMPHCMPVWRRSLHDRYGWFDEARYGTFADWAFWLKALRDGGYGWLNPEPLGYYFVNPTSHNRRGNELERLHDVVESDFIEMFTARRDGTAAHASRSAQPAPPKLNLSGHELFYGHHRNSFNRTVKSLEPLGRTDGEGVLFLPFIERHFVWGADPGEAQSDSPTPITRDWVGILHVPFDAPDWFNPDVSPEVFFETPLWKASRPHCRGIITLAADLEADLKAFDPTLPTLSVRHPSELAVEMFHPEAYHAEPRVVQVGDWLRKLQAIHKLKAPGHDRVMLLKSHTEAFMDHEIAVFGDHRDPAVDMRKMVPNEEYDRLLSRSVVLCLLYATAANNVVIECVARATPILVNPLPAVVEYLGPDYPLYACDENEAAILLSTPGMVDEAHQYLLVRRQEIDLSYEGFCRDIAESEWYAKL